MLLLILGIPALAALALFGVIRAVLKRNPHAGRAYLRDPRVPARRIVATALLVALLGLSLFAGFVGAAIIGAVAPSTVAFANGMACRGGTPSHASYDYSYKPGQRGTAQVFSCQQPDGSVRDATGATFVYAGATFSAGALVLLTLLVLVGWPILRRMLKRLINSPRIVGVAGPDGTVPNPWSASDLQDLTDALTRGIPKIPPSASTRGSSEGARSDTSTGGDGRWDATTGASGTNVGPDARTVAERLEEVERLYRNGLLNRSEYEAARAKIIAEL